MGICEIVVSGGDGTTPCLEVDHRNIRTFFNGCAERGIEGHVMRVDLAGTQDTRYIYRARETWHDICVQWLCSRLLATKSKIQKLPSLNQESCVPARTQTFG